jgi:hypothetical protein
MSEWMYKSTLSWRMPSYGMWRRVDLVWTDVSEEHIASIFRVEKSASEEPAWASGCRHDLHGATSQKTASFMVTVVKTSNLPHFLDLGTSWNSVVSFTSRSLYQQRKSPRTHWIGVWVDPRAGLDDVDKRKFLTLPGLEHRTLGHPTRSQSLYRLSYSGSL